MSVSPWTEDRTRRLQTLWREGRSAEQIASALGEGISRNAVLGKVHRLRLSPAPALDAPARPARLPARARPRQAWGGSADRSDPALEQGRATVLSVGRSQCRWPYGHPGAGDFTLCGRPVGRGAYCPAHAEIAYRPARETPQSLERLARLP